MSQDSDKFSAKWFGQFEVTKLIGKIAVKMDLPFHINLHPVIHVSHKTPFVEHLLEVAKHIPKRTAPVHTVGAEEHLVAEILKHRKR